MTDESRNRGADAPLWTLNNVCLGPSRLRDVSVVIPRGVTAVLGWSGAGKTSLLNVLVGFEKPDRGIFDGPRSFYWSPQNDGLWPHCTAREHLALVRCAEARIDELLAGFDLTERAGARPDELSEGERARLSVARALAAPAKVLVLDEPLAHVDPARVGRYWSVIRAALAAEDRSLVFATHVPEAALAEAQNVVCLRDGGVLHAGPIAEAYANPPSRDVMECLGPGNWMTPEEADLWLDEKIDFARCFRPEQIEIEPTNLSHMVVRSANFLGSFAEAELRHVNAAVVRTFLHRPAAADLQPEMPAVVRLRA
ncbi:MAG: ABC transporter ATP-binding protein [Chthoniobacteraceae bacterium]